MLKERAAEAIKRGLPVPTPPTQRPRLSDPGAARSSSSTPPPSSRSAPHNRRMPLAVKLLALALVVLGAVYGLTLFRDRPSEPGSTAARPARASLAAELPSADRALLGAAMLVPSAQPPQPAPSATQPTPDRTK
jgi:hypothetical protein